jgi:hypothetical protein
MLDDYPFIRGALSWVENKEVDEETLMFQQYRGTLFTASLTQGPPEDEYPSRTGYLLLKYIQPGNVGSLGSQG